jgi:hypothetical protein
MGMANGTWSNSNVPFVFEWSNVIMDAFPFDVYWYEGIAIGSPNKVCDLWFAVSAIRIFTVLDKFTHQAERGFIQAVIEIYWVRGFHGIEDENLCFCCEARLIVER